jgi:thiosulfate reductase cytochrome b subunit
MTDITINSTVRHPRKLHPLALRIMHWTNAVAMIIMIGSGWEIYNDEVIFGWLHFPHLLTVGDGPEGALQWHFAAMWLLMINGLCYLAYGMATGRLSALFFGFQGSRLAHFFGMAAIVGFLVIHVALALTVPKTIKAMITGGPVVDDHNGTD